MRVPSIDFRALYDRFDAPVTALDCGTMCAPYNPGGKPFCCDICQAVPAAYHPEWDYLKRSTTLWHLYGAQDCPAQPLDPAAETPTHMRLLACLGPTRCQRGFRALSCRQFPFFPYITADDRFIGLAYEWAFEHTCWVISRPDLVLPEYRQAFVRAYDEIFALWPHDYESYAARSGEMREHFAAQRRRIPILHRNGAAYLLSPGSERMARVDPERLPRFGPYAAHNS